MIDIDYIDGIKHDIIKDYKLLAPDPFKFSFSPDLPDELNVLQSDIENLVNDISKIPDETVSIDLIRQLVKSFSEQVGDPITDLDGMRDWFVTRQTINDHAEKERLRSSDFELVNKDVSASILPETDESGDDTDDNIS